MPPYCEEHQMYHGGSLWECEEMRTRDRIRAVETARREKAERIAARIRINSGHGLNDTFTIHGTDLQRMLTAAALEALTEKGE